MAVRALAVHDAKFADKNVYVLIRDLVGLINDMAATVNELRADHATVITELTAVTATLADYKTIYDAHTHKLPATPTEDENTSAPDTTAATGAKAPGAASAFTDTSGSSIPATLTAGDADTASFADGTPS